MSQPLLITGIMSGTSLDGVDLATCRFYNETEGRVSYDLVAAETIPYQEKWYTILAHAHELPATGLLELHTSYGHYLGNLAREFHRKNQLNPHYIASHGHTVFHQPARGFSFQLGHGANLAEASGIPVITDFRNSDIAAGGQGAPLVPCGDRILFGAYDACLNIGGIANISFNHRKSHAAHDICVANMAFNHLSATLGMKYDAGGRIGAAGQLNKELLQKLQEISLRHQTGQLSLGREWFEQYQFPLLQNSDVSLQDKLRTLYEFVSDQIARDLNEQPLRHVLVTGGGALNTFLVNLIRQKTPTELVLPESKIIHFKEALIFAFLGLLYINDEYNSLPEFTGAAHRATGGALYKIRLMERDD